MYSMKVNLIHVDESIIIMQAVLKSDGFRVAMCASSSRKSLNPVEEAQKKAIEKVLSFAEKQGYKQEQIEQQLEPDGLWQQIFDYQKKLQLNSSALVGLAKSKFRKEKLSALKEEEVKLLLKHLSLVAGE